MDEKKRNSRKEEKKKCAAREKYRRDTELYREIFHDWESILREKEIKIRRIGKKRETYKSFKNKRDMGVDDNL